MKGKYPESVMTKSRKGSPEVRVLVEKGEYIRYQFADPKTGKILENGKTSIIFKNSKGKPSQIFIIPIAGGKSLLITPKSEEKEEILKKSIWNRKSGKEENLF